MKNKWLEDLQNEFHQKTVGAFQEKMNEMYEAIGVESPNQKDALDENKKPQSKTIRYDIEFDRFLDEQSKILSENEVFSFFGLPSKSNIYHFQLENNKSKLVLQKMLDTAGELFLISADDWERDFKNILFTINSDVFVANSLRTLQGRDDNDEQIGAFTSVYELDIYDMAKIIGHSYFTFYHFSSSVLDQTVRSQSLSKYDNNGHISNTGLLDYKITAYRILELNKNILLKINGITYNANEAGNYLWGLVLDYHGIFIDANLLAELGTSKFGFSERYADEPWEQRAISKGRKDAYKHEYKTNLFKSRVESWRTFYRNNKLKKFQDL